MGIPHKKPIEEWKNGNTLDTGTLALGTIFKSEFEALYGNDNVLSDSKFDKAGGTISGDVIFCGNIEQLGDGGFSSGRGYVSLNGRVNIGSVSDRKPLNVYGDANFYGNVHTTGTFVMSSLDVDYLTVRNSLYGTAIDAEAITANFLNINTIDFGYNYGEIRTENGIQIIGTQHDYWSDDCPPTLSIGENYSCCHQYDYNVALNVNGSTIINGEGNYSWWGDSIPALQIYGDVEIDGSLNSGNFNAGELQAGYLDVWGGARISGSTIINSGSTAQVHTRVLTQNANNSAITFRNIGTGSEDILTGNGFYSLADGGRYVRANGSIEQTISGEKTFHHRTIFKGNEGHNGVSLLTRRGSGGNTSPPTVNIPSNTNIGVLGVYSSAPPSDDGFNHTVISIPTLYCAIYGHSHSSNNSVSGNTAYIISSCDENIKFAKNFADTEILDAIEHRGLNVIKFSYKDENTESYQMFAQPTIQAMKKALPELHSKHGLHTVDGIALRGVVELLGELRKEQAKVKDLEDRIAKLEKINNL